MLSRSWELSQELNFGSQSATLAGHAHGFLNISISQTMRKTEPTAQGDGKSGRID